MEPIEVVKKRARLTLNLLLVMALALPIVIAVILKLSVPLDPGIIAIISVATFVMEMVSYIILKADYQKKGLLTVEEKPYEKL